MSIIEQDVFVIEQTVQIGLFHLHRDLFSEAEHLRESATRLARLRAGAL